MQVRLCACARWLSGGALHLGVEQDNAMNSPVVLLDRSRCIGSGSCTLSAPDVFDTDEHGLVILVSAPLYGDTGVHEAVRRCPVSALSWSPPRDDEPSKPEPRSGT